MILVTGPTGQRKDRIPLYGPEYSQYRGLQYFDREDPAEINLPGINQVNDEPPRVGLTFAQRSGAFLRQDPE